MRTIILCLAFGSILGMGCENATSRTFPPSTKRAAARTGEPVSCTLKSNSNVVLGTIPQMEVRLTNETNDDIYLVGSLDGSDVKMRYPHCYYEVIRPTGEKVAHWRMRGCGLTNPLRIKDFVKVPAGRDFDPYQRLDEWGFFSTAFEPQIFRDPGDYRIRFVYSTMSPDLDAWHHWGDPKNPDDAVIRGLFFQVPQVEVRSNTVTVRVFAPET